MFNLIAISLMAFTQSAELKCPVMGGAVSKEAPTVEYNGAQYSFCCAGCDASFAKSPENFLKTQRSAGNTVGLFLFDPVSRQRLDATKAAATTDFAAIRYPFQTEANKAAFLKDPKKYAAVPTKEALYCPVGQEVVKAYSEASDYVDYKGVRWYMCCDGCGGPFEKEPDKYLAGSDKYVAPAKVIAAPAAKHGGEHPAVPVVTKIKFGKYEAELRVPEEGLFAQEEVDVEFRVVDTTQKDPVEEGFKGVGAIDASAVMTMPSMPGMPEAKPEVHREGVPGDYGIVLFFPHGGDYKIDLKLAIPGDGTKEISFVVDVKDEKPADQAKPQPYKLEVVEWPAHAMAGQSQKLKMRVVDTKTGETQKDFDVAHTKLFHLLLASKDLNWFLHEHPELGPDGTWTIDLTFPAGGQYWVYGDVAPKGKGSRVLIAKVDVHGDKPTWNTALVPTAKAADAGLAGELSPKGEDIPIGRMTTLEVKLFDERTGKPAGDTIPWLGAAGHLMIFHEDGQTVVHSHPAESEENDALVKQGVVRFTGRFPKPGLYKAYAQFSWHESIHTLGFVIEVK